jgi:hypothetical protein
MAGTQRPAGSSAFDDLLAENKKRFDDLYRGGPSRVGSPFGETKTPASGGTASRGNDASAAAPEQSPARRRLNERFGNDWRYEIAERQRSGDEAIVLCKVILGKDGAVRTHFGRAGISRGPVAGATNGVRFRLGAGAAEPDERDAFDRATEAALMNCVNFL